MAHADVGHLVKGCFKGLPHDEAVKWAKRPGQHSAVAFGGRFAYQGYKDVPVSYMFCEDDLTVTPAMQQAGIDNIERASGRKVDVYKYNSDHFPYLSNVHAVVEAVNCATAEKDK